MKDAGHVDGRNILQKLSVSLSGGFRPVIYRVLTASTIGGTVENMGHYFLNLFSIESRCPTRFDGWQGTHAGEREVKKALRKTLFKYQLHQDAEVIDRAYQYISEYY